jgi:hypothetical protein
MVRWCCWTGRTAPGLSVAAAGAAGCRVVISEEDEEQEEQDDEGLAWLGLGWYCWYGGGMYVFDILGGVLVLAAAGLGDKEDDDDEAGETNPRRHEQGFMDTFHPDRPLTDRARLTRTSRTCRD